jgi:hypothetical protein
MPARTLLDRPVRFLGEIRRRDGGFVRSATVALTADLADEVLARLGFSQRPVLDGSAFDRIDGAWVGRYGSTT